MSKVYNNPLLRECMTKRIRYDRLDASIRDSIKSLNKAGYVTVHSCSTLAKDHPKGFSFFFQYVSFKPITFHRQTIIDLQKNGNEIHIFGQVVYVRYDYGCANIETHKDTDKEKIERWNKMIEILLRNFDHLGVLNNE